MYILRSFLSFIKNQKKRPKPDIVLGYVALDGGYLALGE